MHAALCLWYVGAAQASASWAGGVRDYETPFYASAAFVWATIGAAEAQSARIASVLRAASSLSRVKNRAAVPTFANIALEPQDQRFPDLVGWLHTSETSSPAAHK